MAFICPYCHLDIVPSTHSCPGGQAARDATGKLPFIRRPKLLSSFNGTSQTLIARHPCGIYPGYLRKYDAAMQNWGNDIGDRAKTSEWKAFSEKFTLADLAEFGPHEHL